MAAGLTLTPSRELKSSDEDSLAGIEIRVMVARLTTVRRISIVSCNLDFFEILLKDSE